MVPTAAPPLPLADADQHPAPRGGRAKAKAKGAAKPRSPARAAGTARRGGIVEALGKSIAAGVTPADPPGQPPRTKVGAPARDLLALCDAKCAAWAEMEEDDDLLKVEVSKNVRRYLRFYNDIVDRLATMQTSTPLWSTYKLASKKAHVMHMVLSAWSKSGGYSGNVMKVMDEMDFFLQMAPYQVTDFQHPPFLLRQRHEVVALKASPSEFWQLLDKSSLMSAGFSDAAVLDKQRDLLTQRILSSRGGGPVWNGGMGHAAAQCHANMPPRQRQAGHRAARLHPTSTTVPLSWC